MRFRFCWDCDCPDWLLAEIITLSKVKPTTLKELSLQICDSIRGSTLNYDNVSKLFTGTEIDDDSIKALIAALRWILSNGAGAQVDEKVLDSELQQLGLQREQSQALTDVFKLQKEDLHSSLKKQTFKASENVKFSCDIKHVEISDEKHSIYRLNLEGNILDQDKGYSTSPRSATRSEESISVLVTHEQLGSLIHELEDAYNHMEAMKH